MNLKENKGITLIALVITIIVLLILAGVSITMISGDDGIATRAANAKEKTDKADIIERIRLDVTNKQLDTNGKVYKADFIEALEKEGTLSTEEEVLDRTLTTTDGSYQILVKDIYNGPLYEETLDLITFKIGNTEYTAVRGMTFAEWAESEYNTSTYLCDSSMLWDPSGGIYVTETSSYSSNGISPTDIIEENHQYGSRGFAECVFPNSKILNNEDGTYTLAKDVKENDEILYFDLKENTIKTGTVSKIYIHKDATNFVRYTLEDGSYLEATDYHPIYTKDSWKSATQRNGYELPEIGDEVKTSKGWQKITNIELWNGLEDCYDFEILSENGTKTNNYFANGILVQGSY